MILGVKPLEKSRAFLKWAGGKYRLIDRLKEQLPEGKRLIEPFVGAGSVFLNTHYDEYLLNDINPDLIALYKTIQKNVETYLADSQELFCAENNDKTQYYQFREQFNQSNDSYLRSLLFLYLNRHGYNGLCRYNQKGGFNVPFGSYKKPYFPAKELRRFSLKSESAVFVCESYEITMKRARSGDVIYCDPPYAPLSETAHFTSYATEGFSLNDQANLAKLASKVSKKKNVPVLMSNHDTALTRKLYIEAQLNVITVQRTISSKVNIRRKVDELLALYPATDLIKDSA